MSQDFNKQILSILLHLKNNDIKLKVRPADYKIKKIDYIIKRFTVNDKNSLKNKIAKISIDIKNNIRYNIVEKDYPKDTSLPPGLCIFDKIYTTETLDQFHSLLEKVFYRYKDRKYFKHYKMSKLFHHQEHKKRTFLFDDMNVYDILKVSLMMDEKLGMLFFNMFQIY